MDMQDFLNFTTVGLIRTETKNALAIEQQMKKLWDNFDFENLRAPGFFSLGGQSASGDILPYFSWLAEIRNRNPTQVRVLNLEHSSTPNLPERVKAAFANSSQETLYVCFQDGTSDAYILRTSYSPKYTITPTWFAQWLDRQKKPDILWMAVAEKIKEHHELNQLPEFYTENVREYMKTPAAAEVLEFLESNLNNALVLASKKNEFKLIINADDKRYIESGDEDQKTYEMYLERYPEDAKGFVHSDDLYNIKGEMSYSDIADVVDTQKCKDQIWQRLKKNLQDFYPEKELNFNSTEEVKKFFIEMDNDPDMGWMKNTFMQPIQGACKYCDTKFIIPEKYKDNLKLFIDLIEPEYRDTYVPQRDKLQFVPNQVQWTLHTFIKLWTFKNDYQFPNLPDMNEIKNDFSNKLSLAKSFAQRVDSVFHEAFGLALLTLTTDIEKLVESARTEKYTENSCDTLQSKIDTGRFFESFAWNDVDIRSLIALDIANVFGGMGSWNDQSFPDDSEEYEKISNELFESLKTFKNALMNYLGSMKTKFN